MTVKQFEEELEMYSVDFAKDGRTFLMQYAELGNNKIVDYLIKKKAKLNKQDDNGITALYTAAVRDRKYIVNALIKAGADVDVQDTEGDTALHRVMYNRGSKKIVEILILAGADLSIKNEDGHTAEDLMIGEYKKVFLSSVKKVKGMKKLGKYADLLGDI